MGLDTSHDAFHGAYSAFNNLRQEVAHAVGGSYGPHWLRAYSGELARDKDGYPIIDTSLEPDKFYLPDEVTREKYPGLWEFLLHSDCDGEISPEMCVKVADDLEALLPKMPEVGTAISLRELDIERCCASSSLVAAPLPPRACLWTSTSNLTMYYTHKTTRNK